jgi:hypothetical protein
MASKRKLKSYHFSCGNSTDGTVGFCARVKATSKKEAIQILHEVMPETIEVDGHYGDEDTIEYIHVYTGTENLKESDIDEWEWTDEDANETPLQALTEGAWDDDED